MDELRRFAAEAVNHSKILDEQKEYMWNKAEKNKDLFRALARRSFDEIAVGELSAVRNVIKRDFIYGRKTPNETRRNFDIIRNAENTLNMFFCGSKPIGDCNKAELLHQANIHKNRSRAEDVRATIFLEVSKKVKGDEIVRNKITSIHLNGIIRAVNPDRLDVGLEKAG